MLSRCANTYRPCMQCAKQPKGSLLCGFYACENLRTTAKYCTSWRQLEKNRDIFCDRPIDLKFKQLVADICKCLLDDIVSFDGKWFDTEGALALPENERVRHWRTMFDMNDYVLPNIDDLIP